MRQPETSEMYLNMPDRDLPSYMNTTMHMILQLHPNIL